uniref:Uncharacterized protein n=1 Tax=viral metagenome TaxID=1070528 RepID=A0A6M3Y267_9ZZZZ
MQEYNDGSFGNILEGKDLLKQVLDNPEEMVKTKKIHFGTFEELQAMKDKVNQLEEAKSDSVKDYLFRIEKKLNRIILKLGIAEKDEFLIV